MKTIRISDMTLAEETKRAKTNLSFKEKLEIAKLLDKMNMDTIELPFIENPKIDALLIRTISGIAANSAVSVPVPLNGSAEEEWTAVQDAKRPRLRVEAPCSPVRMEYASHQKPAAVLESISQTVLACRALCADVEFSAEDATRSEPDFLSKAIQAAIDAGAVSVTVCDSAGIMTPDEFSVFIAALYDSVPALCGIRLAVKCADDLSMAAACAVAAVKAGADELKVSAVGGTAPAVDIVANIIRNRGDDLGIGAGINFTLLKRSVKNILWITAAKESDTSAFTTGVGIESPTEFSLTINDDVAAVAAATRKLGYELAEDDVARVFESFIRVAAKKPVGAKELDAIIASAALQVPPIYQVQTYVINSGNTLTATANICLTKQDKTLCGISVGDGPIDASILAIEQITGQHYELDDFHIQAVTEGREAMGSALVKLIHNGKLYSGQGISTDIIGASIRAYVNALNKILYEEEEHK